MDWYKGKSLVEVLDSLVPPKRPVDKPFRMPVNDVYKIGGIGTVVAGRIESGTIKAGEGVEIAPGNIKSEAKSIEMHHEKMSNASCGDNVGINVRGVPADKVTRGFVMGSKNNPPRTVEKFIAQVIITNHKGQIKNGYTPVIDCHTAHIACKFNKILSKVDRKTLKEIEKEPQFVK